MTAFRQAKPPTQRLVRRLISFSPYGRGALMRGISNVNGRPLLVLEEGERTTVRLDFSRMMASTDQIVGMKIARQGCEACLVFDERVADLIVWGAKPWYFDGQGYDYNWDRADGVEIAAKLPNGEVVVERILVRGPNHKADWTTRGWGSSGDVIDARSAPIYDDVTPESLLGLKGAVWIDGQAYRVSDFGADFGEDFGE